MSSVSRRRFLQSSAVAAGAAVVVGPAARAMATDAAKSSSPSSSTSSTSTAPAPAPPGGGDDHPATGDPVIAYVNGSTVTVLSGEREVVLKDADLARRITRAAKNDG